MIHYTTKALYLSNIFLRTRSSETESRRILWERQTANRRNNNKKGRKMEMEGGEIEKIKNYK